MLRQSEKLIERRLREEVKRVGGWSIKILSDIISGLPDRLCLFPGGRLAFVETKSTGDKPSPIQRAVHKKLRRLGFPVHVIDKTEQVKEFIRPYERE